MKLALGTAQFGLPYGIANARGQLSLAEGRRILRTAEDAGVSTLDTAIAYGDAEQRLGEIGVEGWQVVSKLPPIPADRSDVGRWVEESIHGSLAALRVDSLHGLLLHRPGQLLEPGGDELFWAMQCAKRDGLVSCIGVSIYDPEELAALSARFSFDLVQSPLSLLDRRLEESGWLARLHADGVEIHTRSVFLQGLLLMPPERRPAKFTRWAPVWSSFDALVAESERSPLELCLGYALSIDEIDRVIVGIDGLAQLGEILEAARRPVRTATDRLPPCADAELLNPALWSTRS